MKTHPLPLLTTALALAFGSAFAAPRAHAAVHTMIVTSDPQYPWTDRTDNDFPEDEGTRDRRSEELITEQYRSIAAYRAARPAEDIPVFVNGDLTAYGHGSQRAVMERLFRILGDNVHLGLRNHDYENNLRSESSGCYNNGCARDSIWDLANHVNGKEGRETFDFSIEPGAFRSTYRGSLAYAFRAPGLDRVLNVQLNNYPDYTATFDSAEDPLRTGMQTGTYVIESSVPWLHNLLREKLTVPPYGSPRDRDYDFAVVHLHDASRLSDEFELLVSGNDVAAVFAGHFHQRLGRYYRNAGTVPVFLSGAASQRTYLIVEHDTGAGELRVYGVRNNDPENKQLIDTVPTPRHG